MTTMSVGWRRIAAMISSVGPTGYSCFQGRDTDPLHPFFRAPQNLLGKSLEGIAGMCLPSCQLPHLGGGKAASNGQNGELACQGLRHLRRDVNYAVGVPGAVSSDHDPLVSADQPFPRSE
jgi:hypothetical protein